MLKHKTRLWVILAAFGLALTAVVTLAALGQLEGEVMAALLAALAVLVPAVIDATAEQKKRSTLPADKPEPPAES